MANFHDFESALANYFPPTKEMKKAAASFATARAAAKGWLDQLDDVLEALGCTQTEDDT